MILIPFPQSDWESLCEVQEHFSRTSKIISSPWDANSLIIRTLSNRLQQLIKNSIDAFVVGGLMVKRINKVKALLEEMTSNNYH